MGEILVGLCIWATLGTICYFWGKADGQKTAVGVQSELKDIQLSLQELKVMTAKLA